MGGGIIADHNHGWYFDINNAAPSLILSSSDILIRRSEKSPNLA